MSCAKIRVVFFDVHETLIYCLLSPPKIFVQLLAELGVPRTLEAVEVLYPKPKELEKLRAQAKGREDEFWLSFNARILHQLGISDVNGRIARHLTEGFKDVRWWGLYPDVKPTLRALQGAGYRLGVIANARHLVLGRLRHLQLMSSFQAITYSEEAGFEKPDPRIFQLAMERMQCVPEEAIHVGDRDLEDIQGAQGAGIRAILLDRDDSHPDAECERIRSLTELAARLRSVNG
jgi:putative hydrolase of the HAD superfamily